MPSHHHSKAPARPRRLRPRGSPDPDQVPLGGTGSRVGDDRSRHANARDRQLKDGGVYAVPFPSSAGCGSGRPGLLDRLQRLAQPADPVGLVLADQAHAPGEGIGA